MILRLSSRQNTPRVNSKQWLDKCPSNLPCFLALSMDHLRKVIPRKRLTKLPETWSLTFRVSCNSNKTSSTTLLTETIGKEFQESLDLRLQWLMNMRGSRTKLLRLVMTGKLSLMKRMLPQLKPSSIKLRREPKTLEEIKQSSTGLSKSRSNNLRVKPTRPSKINLRLKSKLLMHKLMPLKTRRI